MAKNSRIDDIESIGEGLIERKDTRPVCPHCGEHFGNKGLLSIHLKKGCVGNNDEVDEVPVIEAVTVEDTPQEVADDFVPFPAEVEIDVDTTPALPTIIGRKDRGEWYNNRTAIQIFLLNEDYLLRRIDELVNSGVAKNRADVVARALAKFFADQ